SKSTKFTYSQGRRLVGRDSILVRFRRRSANGFKMLYSTPGSFLIENRMDVLSRPVGGAGRRPMTRKRVELNGLSSMRVRRIGTSHRRAAISDAMPATLWSSL